MVREFKDVVFEDVVFDSDSNIVNNDSNVLNISVLIVRLKVIPTNIKHHILKHHILELPNDCCLADMCIGRPGSVVC